MKRNIYVIGLLFLITLFSGCSRERVVDVSGEAVLLLNYREATELVPSSFAGTYIPQVRRNFFGSKLFISVDSKVVSVDSNTENIIPSPAYCSYLDGKEEFVTWFNNLREGICFKNGYVRPLAIYERFGVDSGGSYFYISTYSNGSSTVYSTSQPETPLLTIPAFVAYGIFFYDHTIYVFGSPLKTGEIIYRDVCHEIAVSNNTYSVRKSFEIPGAVVDMSPTSGRLLLDNRSDLFPRWFLYDMKTGKKRSISKRDLYGFFITPDLAVRFKEASK